MADEQIDKDAEETRKSEHAVLETLGELVDTASDDEDEGTLQRIIKEALELLSANLSDEGKATLHYYTANAYESARHIKTRGKPSAWDWRQHEFAEGLFHLRSAHRSAAFSTLVLDRQYQILTNTGNVLSSIGRSVEAIEFFDKVLSQAPYTMALANKAISLATLATAHYDRGQSAVLTHHAYRHFNLALNFPDHLVPGMEAEIRKWVKAIEGWLSADFLSLPDPLKEGTLGKSEKEIAYRAWCLRNRLFLNLLNELGEHPAAAQDTLHAPSFTTKIGTSPSLIGAFNQIKQEYATARYFAWEGELADRPHFADKHTRLINTIDYPAYSLAEQKTRIAFRSAYSILDKLAFILNQYYELQIAHNEINLNRVWFNNGRPKASAPDFNLNLSLVDRQNVPLRGLYWLARDLYDEEASFVAVAEPDAQGIKELRNHIEHKYLKTHSDVWSPEETSPLFRDTWAQSISRSELQAKTVRLLKLTRAAMVYTSLAIHREELVRQASSYGTRIEGVVPMILTPYDDRWKI